MGVALKDNKDGTTTWSVGRKGGHHDQSHASRDASPLPARRCSDAGRDLPRQRRGSHGRRLRRRPAHRLGFGGRGRRRFRPQAGRPADAGGHDRRRAGRFRVAQGHRQDRDGLRLPDHCAAGYRHAADRRARKAEQGPRRKATHGRRQRHRAGVLRATGLQAAPAQHGAGARRMAGQHDAGEAFRRRGLRNPDERAAARPGLPDPLRHHPARRRPDDGRRFLAGGQAHGRGHARRPRPRLYRRRLSGRQSARHASSSSAGRSCGRNSRPSA